MRFKVEPGPVGEIDVFLEFEAKGDGDCLFHSLCFLFHQHNMGEWDPFKLRTKAVAYLGPRVRGEFSDGEYWGYDSAYPGGDVYLERMGTAGVYADFNCVRAVACFYNVLIVVHHPFGDPWFAYPKKQPQRQLNLIYRNRNHYNPLVPKASNLAAASRQVPKSKPRGQPKARRQVSAQLNRHNRIDEDVCACAVSPMPGEPLQVSVYDDQGQVVSSLPIRYCVYAHLTEKPFFYVQPSDETFLSFLRSENAPRYDWYSGSFGKKGRLLGCYDSYFHRMLRFEEQCYYAQRALFGSNVAGCSGRISVLRVPLGATAKLRNGVEIQVHDGWGYIKDCLAKKLKSTRVGEEIVLERPEANFGMFQWLRALSKEETDLENEVVDELFATLKTKLAAEKSEARIARPRAKWARDLIAADPAMGRHPYLVERFLQESVHRALRRMTTADPDLWGGIAMPVPGDALVLPCPQACERLRGLAAERIAVFRNPGDSLNWVCTETIDRKSGLSKLLGRMESVQYTLTGKEDGKLGFYKGMLGVIPDNLWPKDWNARSMVVCNADRKASETWVGPDDPDTAKKSKESAAFTMEGCLVVLQWFQAGSCVGVPYEGIQKKLAGDYDGDMAVLLSGDEFPKTCAYIAGMVAKAKSENPKLTKTSTPMEPGESRARCIQKIKEGSQLTGAWSNLAAMLLSVNPAYVDQVAQELGHDSADKLLQRISLGIKQGTDAFKTRVDVEESNQEATELREAFQERGIKAPHTKLKYEPDLFRDRDHIPPVLRLQDEPPEDAWKKKFAVGDWMHGIPAALMRRVIPELSVLAAPDPAALESYQDYVKAPAEEEAGLAHAIGQKCTELLTRSPTGGDDYLQPLQTFLQPLRQEVDARRLAELTWWALHDSRYLPSGVASWLLPQGVFHAFHQDIPRIVDGRPLRLQVMEPSLEVCDEEARSDSDEDPTILDRDFYNDFEDDFDDDDLL